MTRQEWVVFNASLGALVGIAICLVQLISLGWSPKLYGPLGALAGMATIAIMNRLGLEV